MPFTLKLRWLLLWLVLGGSMSLAHEPIAVHAIPTTTSETPADCVAGYADIYPCRNINLLAHLPLEGVGGGSATDVWGWDDAVTGHRYAILGRTNGTAFVDVTDPRAPIYVAELPSHVGEGPRALKVYERYALIVAQIAGHGMQVLDLAALRPLIGRTDLPVTLTESAYYGGAGQAQNIAIDQETHFAYAVGLRGSGLNCNGGLHMINLSNPSYPVFGGCFSGDGFTQAAQCLIYHGPDRDYYDHEVCFNANEDTLTIVDVSNKFAPLMISRTDYVGRGYTFQGGLAPDQRHFLLADTGDELQSGVNTTTYIWDVSNLDAPYVERRFVASTAAIDHNLFARGRFVYQANNTAGLRVLRLNDDGDPGLELIEDAYFDVYPADDGPTLNGAQSAFPYFTEEGLVAVSSQAGGLYVLRLAHIAFVPMAVTLRQMDATGNSVSVWGVGLWLAAVLAIWQTSRGRLSVSP